jgi:hypothetical protein
MYVNTFATRQATKVMFERYQIMLGGLAGSVNGVHCAAMYDLAAAGIAGANTLPIDKLNRWLGFIQAFAAMSGATTIFIEREMSRHIFHAAYQSDGIPIPPTVDVMSDNM